jgi:hypothetical protein
MSYSFDNGKACVVGSDIVLSPITNVCQLVNPLFQLVTTPVRSDIIGSSRSSNCKESKSAKMIDGSNDVEAVDTLAVCVIVF